MGEFIFNFSDDLSSKKRNANSLKINFGISLLFFVFILSISDWEYAVGISFFVFLVQFLKSSRWNKYFISHIELKNNQVLIRYKDKNEEKVLSGNKSEFKVTKQIAFNKTRTAYLAIYKNNYLYIKQFEMGEWNENTFNKVISAFS